MTKVAVYGSLRQGMGNHGILRDSELLGTTATVENYTMYSLGGFPRVALDVGGDSPIVVEVYKVDDSTLERLHRLEGYRGPGMNNFYDLAEVETVDFGTVNMYYINGYEGRRPVVPNGDWVAYRGDAYALRQAY